MAVFCAGFGLIYSLLIKRVVSLTKQSTVEPVTAASRLGAAASLAVVLFGFGEDRISRSER